MLYIWKQKLNSVISITDIARNTVKKLMMEDGFDHSTDFVRVGVKSGGCSGLSYQLKFDKMIQENDKIFEDNGIGFPENRDRLIEPYITNKANGTGLGLAICKKIIEDHGGEINLLDSEEYGGACVRLKFLRV